MRDLALTAAKVGAFRRSFGKRDRGSRAQVKDALPVGYSVPPFAAVPHFTGDIIRCVEKCSHLHAAKSPDGEQG